jgi:hypothetical protein
LFVFVAVVVNAVVVFALQGDRRKISQQVQWENMKDFRKFNKAHLSNDD